MFSLSTVPAVPHEDPWHLPLQERMRLLARRPRAVAYFYEQADNSTFRYRVHNMVEVLNDGEGDIGASYFFHADLTRLEEIAQAAELLVIGRTRYDHRVNRLVAAFRRRGKRVLFDVDDFVFDTDYVHLLVNTLDLDADNPQVWNDWFAYLSRMGAALKLCDGGITTNEYLAARMRAFAGIPVEVVPNFMNREQLALSERVFEAKATQSPGQDGLIHLGYFSGSPSHNRDFAMVVPALEELLEEDERLGVVVVGYIEAGPRLERFGSRVKRYPFQDYVNLQRLIGSVEFNLMPLQFNTFTDCKSELKYFEAAAVGTLSIASPSHVYARAIDHGVTGFLSRSYEWAGVIRQALGRLGEYRAIAARAHADALGKYAWFTQRDVILRALGLR
ncbi:glycosyltransferase [Caenimonas aquaedulcis]|uniref:Glycosyltransferase n=1 Tax=Caenimonas aquaedulcis TaxID=2793270 RepID=A0A931MI58_9BURK|nr:glycosyltransferase [Caenimonas aquaedulcis]MBG9389776.1 glycosyltransferase [Caenimonas aquaedulcis]